MRLVLALQLASLVLLPQTGAIPSPVTHYERTILPRAAGDPTGPSTTVQTTEIDRTTFGPMTEVCNITLTPITGDNGDAEVLMEKSCTISFASTGATSETTTTTSTSTTIAATSTAAAGNAGQEPSDAPTSSATDTTVAYATATPAAGEAASVIGVSSVTLSSTDTGSLATTSSAATSAAGTTPAATEAATFAGVSSVSLSATGVTVAAATSAPAASVSGTASAAAEQASTTTAAFVLPGQKLSVLPIGLGVFAGISAIALIVVGLATYERTKYRKAFRQRKLAEGGASMGYGGMAQRA